MSLTPAAWGPSLSLKKLKADATNNIKPRIPIPPAVSPPFLDLDQKPLKSTGCLMYMLIFSEALSLVMDDCIATDDAGSKRSEGHCIDAKPRTASTGKTF